MSKAFRLPPIVIELLVMVAVTVIERALSRLDRPDAPVQK